MQPAGRRWVQPYTMDKQSIHFIEKLGTQLNSIPRTNKMTSRGLRQRRRRRRVVGRRRQQIRIIYFSPRALLGNPSKVVYGLVLLVLVGLDHCCRRRHILRRRRRCRRLRRHRRERGREGGGRGRLSLPREICKFPSINKSAVDVDAPNPVVSRNHDVSRFCREWSCFEGQADVKRMDMSSPHCWSRFSPGVAPKFGAISACCLEELYPSCLYILSAVESHSI
jgi:hypothetical protein